MTRQTTAEWAADTKLYPEGHRLMDTETGTVRVSKGGTIGTYALAWVPSTGGPSAWGGITGTLSDQTDLVAALARKAGNVRDYVGGIVVLPGDLIQRNGILYYSVATQFTATNWGADVASFTEIGVTSAAIAATLPQRYKFTGDGGAATGTIGVNTYPMAVTVTNPVAGAYRFTAASGTPFTVGKTYVSVAVVETTNPLTWRLTQLDSTTVRVEIFDTTSGTATDPASGYLITIETEP